MVLDLPLPPDVGGEEGSVDAPSKKGFGTHTNGKSHIIVCSSLEFL